jgi:hypothetical protein
MCWPAGFRCPRCEGRKAVFTDAWGSYKALRQLGIDHRPRQGGHGRQALNVLPWAHTVFGNLKTWLRGTFHGVSPKHLQRLAWTRGAPSWFERGRAG